MPDSKQQIIDEEHLRLLTLFYRISAAITAFFACFPLIHLGLGIMFVNIAKNPSFNDSEGPPGFIGWFLIIFAIIIILCGWLLALLEYLTAKYLAERRHHTFCQVTAGILCIFIPFGTIQGVVTLVVLSRSGVSQLFSATPKANQPAPAITQQTSVLSPKPWWRNLFRKL